MAGTGDLCYQISSTEVATSDDNDYNCEGEDCDPPPSGCTITTEIAGCTTTCDGAITFTTFDPDSADADAAPMGTEFSVTCAGAKAPDSADADAAPMGTEFPVTCAGAKAHVFGAAALAAAAAAFASLW
jgi:hypothetical protein